MTDSQAPLSGVLIACIGNIFLGDDGFGTEVARRLAARSLPPGVIVKDFGISGLDLTWALLEPYELIILVDACQRGGTTGTLYLIEPDPADPAAPEGETARLETHGMNPTSVLRAIQSMGGARARILIVGCEPGDLGLNDEGEGRMGLTAPVEAAIDAAIQMIEKQIPKYSEVETTEMALQLY